ncbi:Uncharacterised protein [Bordetella trematum]|uniref:Uncharacterized protein n=1 Tax=Bordetella trematum TaxID=123899 RepID=A0A157PTJ5_9BORD|nr:hypothetical protein [Bordetella trematum]NNH18517.1 hypothetical protein [Bordetella trematum]SAI36883.1 Uncharacterised protein [Bordetella trematum]SAI66221.1 Uncharacterised protein [Bordetella trematum]SUV96704.1 Uncharacterised protein [Bordetella trematum]
MFSMVLFSDDKLTMHLNWFGMGALTIIDAHGRKRRAHPIQKRYLQAVTRELQAIGVKITPDDPVCRHALGEIAHAIYDFPPGGLVWTTALNRSPRETALAFFEEAKQPG